MFKQLHINITLDDALILMPKYQKMLKALLSNKEKLQELANTPLNENCSAVIQKKLPKKLRDPGKFLIPCGFTDFIIVDYESDPRVSLILGRPFLRTARALIDVHGEEMILRDDLNYTKDLHPSPHDNPLSGSTTYFSNSVLKEFADELPQEYDDNLQFDIKSDLKEIEFLLYQDKDSSLKD
nr:reverse transcriptase domain-containing protein [Tanacetum cinerariifolium]